MGLEDKMQEWEALKHYSSKANTKPTLDIIDYHKDDKKTIVLLGDTHIGSKYFDEELLIENLEWCKENNIPMILMGDMIETATRDSVGAGIYEQDEIVDKQIEHFYTLFEDLANKGLIIGLHQGNHEARLFKSSGLDISKIMAKTLKIKYFGYAKLHYIRVGNQGYLLYTTHGASGATMPHTKIKAAIKLADMIEAEIYAMGHVHQLSHHVRNYYKADLRKRKIIESQKHFILTGSYLSHWNSYGHIKGYEPMRKGSAKLKLNGKEHRIRVSL